MWAKGLPVEELPNPFPLKKIKMVSSQSPAGTLGSFCSFMRRGFIGIY